ncbi:MAG: hypothetical protein M0Q91_07705 [Methanoregula sp.]|jgi:hypothetical protein|nr:hypothetical protein [Methanoregula sp.]
MVLEGKAEAFAAADREMIAQWQKAGPALQVALLPTLNKSVEQCPYESGTLAGSGRIDDPVTEGDVTFCDIGFHTPYALKQHEDLTLHHPAMTRAPSGLHARNVAIAKYGGGFQSQSGKKAKYLEDPIREDISIIPERYRQALGEIS